MRLYDKVMRVSEPMDADIQRTIELAKSAGLFDVTNTFEYMASLEEKARDAIEISDMTSIVPPFPTTWLEYRVEPGSSSDIAKAHYRNHAQQVALLLRMHDLGEEDGPRAEFEEDFMPLLDRAGKNIDQGVRWLISARQVLDFGGKIAFEPYTRFWFLDGEGRPVVNRDSGYVINAVQAFKSVPDPEAFCAREDIQNVNRHTHLAPLFALSLLHCKNVKMTDSPDVRTRQQRRRDDRSRLPVAKFHTLQIEPMKQVLLTEGGE